MIGKIQTNIKNKQKVHEKRTQIVESVVKLFMQKGYERTSMREICEKTGMTMGHIYDYIGKKEDLLYLVHDHLMNGIYGSFEDLEDKEWENIEQLKSIVENYFLQSLKYKKEIILMYRETWLLNDDARRLILEKQNGLISKLKDFLDKGVKAGSLHINDTQIMASLIIFVVGMPSLRAWSLKDYKGNEKKMIDILTDTIMKSLI